MSEEQVVAEAAAGPASETRIVAEDPKVTAMGLPAKEQIEGFEFHAFSGERKAFLQMTGNELEHTEKHVTAYKTEHPDWEAELLAEDKAKRDEAVKAANEISDQDAKDKALKKAESDWQGAMAWELMKAAVPDFLFHLAGLGYLCIASEDELADLIGKPRKTFVKKVLAWWKETGDEKVQRIAMRGFQEVIESNIGNDYKVKEDAGAKPSPN